MINQNIQYSSEERILKNVHSKPNYIEIKDGNGNNKWKNVGGHGHHTNFCRNTKMVEKTEYFKKTLDCLKNNSDKGLGPIDNLIGNSGGNIEKSIDNDSDLPSSINDFGYLNNCENSFCLNPLRTSYISGGTEEFNYGLEFSSTTTLSFWVYTKGINPQSDNIIVSKFKEGFNQRGWKLSITGDGNIKFSFQNGQNYIVYETNNGNSNFLINKWANIVLTYDGTVGLGTSDVADNGIKIYINGSENDNTQNIYSPSNNISTSSDTNFIMGNQDSNNILAKDNFNGVILSGKRWGRVLTSPSIQQIYQNGPEENNVTNGIYNSDILFDYYMCDATINGGNYEIVDRKDSLLTYRTVSVNTGININECLGINFSAKEVDYTI